MSLPKLNVPVFELTIPSTKATLKYRPFLVKEEKVLLIAMESIKEEKNEDKAALTILSALRNIIKNCSMSDINVNALAQFDIEYIFLKIRSKSVGEVTTVNYRNDECETESEKGVDGTCLQKLSINLNNVEMVVPDGHTKKIMITEDIGVMMKYPTPEDFLAIKNADETSSTFAIITKCIEQIFDKDNVHLAKDVAVEEITAFIDSLTKTQIEKLFEFFTTMPKLKKDIKHTCVKCGKELNIQLEGMHDFFE